MLKNKRANKLQLHYAFLNVFPTIILVTNLSFYVFPFLVRTLQLNNNTKVKYNRVEHFLIAGFIIGTTISMLDIWALDQGFSRIENGLAVWPNYVYWTFVLFVFSIYRNQINWWLIGKASFWGLIASILYFHIPFLNELRNTLLFKGLQQNIFSFILIIFTPLALYYTKFSHGKRWMYFIAIIVILAATLSGSRSGTGLVTIEILVMLIYLNRKSPMLYLFALFLSIVLLFFSSLIKNTQEIIYDLNPRAHAFLYEKDILKKDPSYLTRLAIIEKGISLFKESPITGIGINNFSDLRGKVLFNFEGGKSIKHNEDFIQKASAHNSYLSILTETGLAGFIPFTLLLLITFFKTLKRALKGNDLSTILLIGFTGMLIHMYFISSILNVFAWFYLALVISNNEDKPKQKKTIPLKIIHGS